MPKQRNCDLEGGAEGGAPGERTGAHLAGREVLLLTVPIPERRGWMSITLPPSKINREKFYLRGVWLLPFCLTPSPGTHAGWDGGIWEEATE